LRGLLRSVGWSDPLSETKGPPQRPRRENWTARVKEWCVQREAGSDTDPGTEAATAPTLAGRITGNGGVEAIRLGGIRHTNQMGRAR
jgi:hypothetical protein